MKITNLEVLLTGTAWRNFLFVRLTTSEGLVGWGDGTLKWKESTVRDLILDFGKRYVVGVDPFDIEDLWFKLYQLEHYTGPIMFAAMAGIETAMWALVGKATGQPVYNLVSGRVRSAARSTRTAGMPSRAISARSPIARARPSAAGARR
jgi:galactonate dehydratase